RFALKAEGDCLTLRFEERYYGRHLGFLDWTPTSNVWRKPICGWCSWAAHRAGINEQQMVEVAEFFARNLKEYGYTVIQMDDGYQRLSQGGPEPLKPGEGVAERWATPNEKFPHGLAWLAGQISERGLTPGIWVGSYLPLGLDPSWYVEDSPGKPHKGEW